MTRQDDQQAPPGSGHPAASAASFRRDRDRLRSGAGPVTPGPDASPTTPQEAAVDGDRPAVAEPTRAAAEPARRRRKKRKGGALRETAIVVVSALVLSVLIKTFLVQAFFIPSGSMEDTLAVGDRVLVSKLSPGPLDVNRGDIVVFLDPGGWLEDVPDDRGAVRRGVEEVLTFVGLLPQDAGEHLIKRIIGVGGDTVECCDAEGRLMVNGVVLDEPYLKPGVEPSLSEFSATVPQDHVWLMGDNRSNSQDSRSHQGDPGGGAVPMDNVVGNAMLVMWPVDHWTLLRNPGETFADVPAP